MLFAIYLAMTGLFVLLGVVFAAGKGTGLIAGYNTASAEEKANYDKKKLCKAMSRLMFALAGCWLRRARFSRKSPCCGSGWRCFLLSVLSGPCMLTG